MKRTLLLLATTIALNAATAQDTVRVTVCTKLWKTNAPITATTIASNAGTAVLDSTQSCTDFEFIMSQYPPDATFSFSAGKDQDAPLNGVTVVDLVRMSTHILGLDPLPAFGMIAADANKSYSITTFDIVETQKILLGIYQQWPNNKVWRFIPEYSLPFTNPGNPFMGLGAPSLTKSQLQAMNGGTITIIGTKTGDVDGDVNPTHAFQGPDGDEKAVVLPDIMLQAGVPITIPFNFQTNGNIRGLQFELVGLPGAVVFDTITVDPALSSYFKSNDTGTSQNSRIRAVFAGGQQVSPQSMTLNLTLTSNAAIALKDAFQFNQTTFLPILSDNNDVYQLALGFSGSVNTHNPEAAGIRILAANPNPFDEQATVTVELTEAGPVLLEVMDMTGRILFAKKTDLAAGIQQLTIPGAAVPQGGMVNYRVTAGNQTATGKLICKH